MRLWLIRHAAAGWGSGAATDYFRPLNAHGERDGPRMAAWLARQKAPASWIWTSDAVRARGTARFVAEGFAAAAPTLVDDHRLYNAPPEQLLDVVRETPPDVRSAALVAHNPGMTVLVNLLVDDEAVNELPTFGIAGIDVSEPWAGLAFGRGHLAVLTSPRTLNEEPS